MRRHVEAAMAFDPRIRLCPGDPLPHLRRAYVLVHPSFQEGFGYAPMEALARQTPVVASIETLAPQAPAVADGPRLMVGGNPPT